MKQLLAKTVPCITFLLFTINLKAQNQDYVIANGGDTLKCKITYSFLSGTYNYKTPEMSEAIRIKTKNIKEFFISDKKLLMDLVFDVNNRFHIYMTAVEKGKINLYQITTNTSSYSNPSSITQWFISKGSDSVKLLKNNTFYFFSHKKKRENYFAELIGDNKDVYNKYTADDKFSFEQIRNLVHLYNTGEPLKGSDN